LGAQKIKTQFASVRLEERKQQMARFASDTLKLMGHIVTSFFDPQVIATQSSIMQSPDGVQAIKKAQEQAMAQQQAMMQAQPGMPPPVPPQEEDIVKGAMELLKSGRMVAFRVEVTADTMVEAEQSERQEQTTAFMGSMTQFVQASAKLPPNTLPLTTTLILWAVRQFRVGRDIEGQISSAIDKLLADAENAAQQPPPEDPKVTAAKMKAESDAAAQQAQQQTDFAKFQMEAKAAQEEAQRDMMKLQAEIAADRERSAAEIQALREKNAAEIEAILVKANIQAEAAQQKAVVDAEAKSAEQQQSLSFKEAAHEQTMEHTAEAGALSLEQQKAQAEAKPKGGSDA
jgi:hypothetical protein